MEWMPRAEYNKLVNDQANTYKKAVQSEAEVKRLKEKIDISKQKAANAAKIEAEKINSANETYAKFDSKLRSANAEIRDLIDSQNRLYNQKVDLINSKINAVKSDQNRIDSQVKQLSDRMNREFQKITNSFNSQKARAKLYADKFNELINVISQLNPTKLMPNEYDNLNKKLNTVNNDIKNGDYGAAISVSQNSIFLAQELEEKLRNLNNEFIRLKHIINADIQNNEEFIKNCDDDKDFSISYWSYNYFDEISDSFNEDIKLFKKYLDDMNIKELQALEAKFVEYLYKLVNCKSFALGELEAYEKIVSLANAVNGMFKNSTVWTLNDSGFIDKDARKSYYIGYANDYSDICCFTVNKDSSNNPILSYNVTSPDTLRIENIKQFIFSILKENNLISYMDEDNRKLEQNYESNKDFLNACGVECDENNIKALSKVKNQEIVITEGKNE